MKKQKRRRPRKYRDCVVCGARFEVGRYNGNAKTCSSECSKERRRQTKIAYRPTENAKRPVRRAANLEESRAREAAFARKYRAIDPQPGRDRARKYQAENREAVKAAKARYYIRNREKVRAAQKDWERRNREEINARRRRDYAAEKGALVRRWLRRDRPEDRP